jgi:hypothetical protein
MAGASGGLGSFPHRFPPGLVLAARSGLPAVPPSPASGAASGGLLTGAGRVAVRVGIQVAAKAAAAASQVPAPSMIWRNRRRRGLWPGPRNSAATSQPASPRGASRAAVSATTSGSGAAFRASVTARPSDRSRIARVCGQGAGDGLGAGAMEVTQMTYHPATRIGARSCLPVPRSMAASQRRHHGRPSVVPRRGGTRARCPRAETGKAKARRSRGCRRTYSTAIAARRSSPGRHPPPRASIEGGWGGWICTPPGILSACHYPNYSEIDLLRLRNAMILYPGDGILRGH